MRFLTYADLKDKGVDYSKEHLWRLIKAGRFPKPVKGLQAANCWPEPEVDEAIAERLAARETTEAA
jgi:prophage regulatory protein